ncbi:efflux RND transporter periplasmic adaptor subunit [Rhodopila sp.]|uniref:efflux RND transporter periplasmic adaptor subunit n=1 Tax=Rhodopila sp. TaxID=2480087 RepID=UPI002C8358EB|nr:efflux RND transporter periplasmic adaptor subunit [Rhodopila sp.]HVZ10200.1 efflux RND transporter periplasmic adaptor subunit [Rhodopila sp.]
MNDMTTLPRTQAGQRVRKPRLWLRYLVMLVLIGLLGAGLVFFHQFKSGILNQITEQIRNSVPVVATGKATLADWQPRQIASGSVRAVKGADMSAEIGGIVDEIDFESGQVVQAGAVLLRLRPNDDEAKLQQLQANADLAAITLARDQRQLAAKAIAQATVDTDIANLKVARAQVAAQQALIAEKTVKAPFTGRLGLRQVDVGQYLSPGTAIVTLQQIDPMFVDFYLPQQALSTLKTGEPVEVTSDAWPGRTFNGTLTSLNARIDPDNRMIQVRATVPNPDGTLVPGMYVTASVASGAARKLVTVPNMAVAYNPYGTLVYVVRPEKDKQGKEVLVAHQQFVTTGDARGDRVSILKGLKDGDVIVTAGQLKLHNGSVIEVNNAVEPPGPDAPVPQDQ